MMLDWNDCRRQLGTTTAGIGRISPDTGDAAIALPGHRDCESNQLASLAVEHSGFGARICKPAVAADRHSARVMDAYAAKTAAASS